MNNILEIQQRNFLHLTQLQSLMTKPIHKISGIKINFGFHNRVLILIL